jgi:hypothetical protein
MGGSYESCAAYAGARAASPRVGYTDESRQLMYFIYLCIFRVENYNFPDFSTPFHSTKLLPKGVLLTISISDFPMTGKR